MRVAFIAAGAASMYCGSCLRDNALAGALIRRGVDLQIIPLYTPLRVDRDALGSGRVFYGGVNIYLQHRWAFFRRFGWLDRLFDSRPMMRLASAMAGMTDAAELGPLTLATLEGDEGDLKKELDRLADWLATDFKPDLINLPNSMFVGAARTLRERTGAPVLCSLTGEDLFIEGLREPWKTRAIATLRARARQVDGFIAISRYYASHMAGLLGVPEEKIHVVPLGLNPEGFIDRPEPRPERPFTIGYLARLAPEKGLHNLIEAFRELKTMPGCEDARLIAAGWTNSAGRKYLADCQAKLRAAGLDADFEYRGELTFDEKAAFLAEIDVLSVPTVYRDPKGLFVLEALAAGVPAVQPAHGAFPELIEATGGGDLFPPGDAAAHARALHALASDPARAARLGAAGRAAVRDRFTDGHMAEATLAVYRQYAPGD